MDKILLFTIGPEDEGRTVARYLRRRGVSHRVLVDLKREPDGLTIGGQTAFTNRPLHAGEELRLFLREPETSDIVPQPGLALPIVYEDDDLFVVDKPTGMAVHPSPQNRENTVANALAAVCFHLASLHRDRGDLSTALEYSRQNLALDRKLVQMRGAPVDLHNLAHGCSQMADIRLSQGNMEGAQALFEESLTLAQQLAQSRGLPEDQRLLVACLNRTASVRLKNGDTGGARPLYRQALALARQLAQANAIPDDLLALATSCSGSVPSGRRHRRRTGAV